jgi:site-specific DNA-methyltransferase (adenine-specific)
VSGRRLKSSAKRVLPEAKSAGSISGKSRKGIQLSPPSFATHPSGGNLQLRYADEPRGLYLFQGDSMELLDRIASDHPDGWADMIFADPPYFLSNGGITCQNGKMVSVNKGDWDRSRGPEQNHEFNRAWLERCQKALKPNGTIWVSGTHHVIHSVGYAMQQLGYKLLNDITWEKPNPPPNLSCRYFTHATETILWAARDEGSKHTFNYQAMKEANGGRQMKSVWKMLAPRNDEKLSGKHPAQKPMELIERCILASTLPSGWILDPFGGSGTTAIAAARTGRGCVITELDPKYAALSENRLRSLESATG